MPRKLLSNLRWIAYALFFFISIGLISCFTSNVVLCNIGCSILASVGVAIFIDVADILKRRDALSYQRTFLLQDYHSRIKNLPWDLIEYVCSSNLSIELEEKYSLSSLLDIMFDNNTYALSKDADNGCSDFDDAFVWTKAFISGLEKASNYLYSEQAVLLMAGFLSEKDITFFKQQTLNCRRIQRYCDKKDPIRVKKGIASLIKKHEQYFGNNTVETEYVLSDTEDD